MTFVTVRGPPAVTTKPRHPPLPGTYPVRHTESHAAQHQHLPHPRRGHAGARRCRRGPSGGFERGGWLVPRADTDMGLIMDGWFDQADAILLRPLDLPDDADVLVGSDRPANAIAAALNTYPKHVVSTSPGDEDLWQNTTLVRGDVVGAVRRLREASGRELQVHGSWQLARCLHDAGLVDVYRLLYFPVVAGQGKKLFDGVATASSFRLGTVETTGAGAACLTLRPAGFGAGGVRRPRRQGGRAMIVHRPACRPSEQRHEEDHQLDLHQRRRGDGAHGDLALRLPRRVDDGAGHGADPPLRRRAARATDLRVLRPPQRAFAIGAGRYALDTLRRRP